MTRPTSGASAPAGGTRRPLVCDRAVPHALRKAHPGSGARHSAAAAQHGHIVFQVTNKNPGHRSKAHSARKQSSAATTPGWELLDQASSTRCVSKTRAGDTLEARRRRRSVDGRHRVQLQRRSGRRHETICGVDISSGIAAASPAPHCRTSPARAARACLDQPRPLVRHRQYRGCRLEARPGALRRRGTLGRALAALWNLAV